MVDRDDEVESEDALCPEDLGPETSVGGITTEQTTERGTRRQSFKH